MIDKYKFSTLALLVNLLALAIPATAQQAEVVLGNYIYRILDAQRACVDLYAGKEVGANTILEAWHSPIPGNHNRCKFKYITTWQNNAGWNGGLNGVFASGGVNGSHSDNGNTDPKEGTVNIDRNRACNQQQGTPWSFIPRNGYIYCKHRR